MLPQNFHKNPEKNFEKFVLFLSEILTKTKHLVSVAGLILNELYLCSLVLVVIALLTIVKAQ